MSLKHTGAKALQQDTIDALNNIITKQSEILTQETITQNKLDMLEIQIIITNKHLSELTGEDITDDDI